MRIAIISDIHGNLEALKTTLEDIKKQNVDKIICLGDIILKGAHSNECVKLIKENCDIVLMGNCDNFFDTKVDENYQKIYGVSMEVQQSRIDAAKKHITEESKEYLRTLPYSTEFYMSRKFGKIISCTS